MCLHTFEGHKKWGNCQLPSALTVDIFCQAVRIRPCDSGFWTGRWKNIDLPIGMKVPDHTWKFSSLFTHPTLLMDSAARESRYG